MARRPFSAFQALVTDRLEGHEGTEVVFEGVHVGPDSFHALGIPLLAGREVTAGDFTAGRPVALVNERLVRQFWPDQWVLGKQIEFIKKKYEVIGIVRDARLETPTEAPRPTVYFAMDAYQARHPNFILRTRDHPESLIKPIRAELLKVHRRLGESEVFTMHEAMRRPFVAQRNVMNLLAEIGAVALGLTVLGVYGLTAYLVRRRTREIGIRLAVGAQR